MRPSLLRLLSLLFIANTTVASAGVALTVEMREPGAEVVKKGAILIDGDRLRIQNEGESQYFIYRGSPAAMFVVEPAKKSYMQIDEAMMSQVGAKMSEAQKMMEAQLANLPEAQRKQIEQMMAGRGMAPAKTAAAPRPAVEIRPTDETRTIGEYPCRRHDLWRGEERIAHAWVTQWSAVDLTKDDFVVFESLTAFVEKLTSSLGDNPMMSGIERDMPLAELRNLDGLPILSVQMRDGKSSTETRVTGIARKAIADDSFLPPADYKKQDVMAGVGR